MRRMLLLVVAASFLLPVAAGASGTPSIPSGERALGQSVIEPVYNDEQAGAIGYVSTPRSVPDPVKGTPALEPFFLPVYPAGSTVGPRRSRLRPMAGRRRFADGRERMPGSFMTTRSSRGMPRLHGAGPSLRERICDRAGNWP